MLVACFTAIMTRIVAFGDSAVSNGVFGWATADLAIPVWNANNHRITWGFLGTAVHTLEDFNTANIGAGRVSTFMMDRTWSRKGCSDYIVLGLPKGQILNDLVILLLRSMNVTCFFPYACDKMRDCSLYMLCDPSRS